MKILANDGISKAGQTKLEAAGYTVITDKVNQEDLISYIQSNEIAMILVRSATTVRADMIDACPSIKLIGRGGVGMDNIDVAYAREKGIEVINTPASSSQSVAELVMAQMYSVSRFLNDSYKNLGENNFSALKKNYGKGIELRGKTLGILGFGRIGQSLASYALGTGMRVIPIGLNITTHKVEVSIGLDSTVSVELTTVNDLASVLHELDFLSIHVPKQKDGGAVIDANAFSKMKKGIRIMNAARGGVIDEEALLDALDNGTVSFAALDVYNNEPNPNQKLISHPKIACTPHIGAATLEAQDRIGEELADLITQKFGKH
jgi:D-3-phosphoglycerate dehydrogenase